MHFEMYQEQRGILSDVVNGDKPRDWRWRLIGENGEPIAASGEGYVNKADCLHAIALVKGTDASTPVNEA